MKASIVAGWICYGFGDCHIPLHRSTGISSMHHHKLIIRFRIRKEAVCSGDWSISCDGWRSFYWTLNQASFCPCLSFYACLIMTYFDIVIFDLWQYQTCFVNWTFLKIMCTCMHARSYIGIRSISCRIPPIPALESQSVYTKLIAG